MVTVTVRTAKNSRIEKADCSCVGGVPGPRGTDKGFRVNDELDRATAIDAKNELPPSPALLNGSRYADAERLVRCFTAELAKTVQLHCTVAARRLG
jgi:hypothetical protein